MTKLRTVGLATGFILVCVVVVSGTLYLSDKYLPSNPAQQGLANCKGSNHPAQHVTIANNFVQPALTQAKLCDTLTITNSDDTQRLMAFGPHDHHIEYDGTSEKLLAKGQSLTVTLNKAGTFIFHDHLEQQVLGQFIVSK